MLKLNKGDRRLKIYFVLLLILLFTLLVLNFLGMFRTNAKITLVHSPVMMQQVSSFSVSVPQWLVENIKELNDSCPTSIRGFWDWFYENQNEIYNAQNGDEEVLKELSRRLLMIDRNLDYSLAWTNYRIVRKEYDSSVFHQGILTPQKGTRDLRRVLSITCKRCNQNSSHWAQALVICADIGRGKGIHCGIEKVQIDKNWIIQLGPHPAENIDSRELLGIKAKFLLRKTGNGKIDIKLYADFLDKDAANQNTPFVSRFLGSYLVQDYVGCIKVDTIDKAPADAANIVNLKAKFESLLTPQQRFKNFTPKSSLLNVSRYFLWKSQCEYSFIKRENFSFFLSEIQEE